MYLAIHVYICLSGLYGWVSYLTFLFFLFSKAGVPCICIAMVIINYVFFGVKSLATCGSFNEYCEKLAPVQSRAARVLYNSLSSCILTHVSRTHWAS